MASLGAADAGRIPARTATPTLDSRSSASEAVLGRREDKPTRSVSEAGWKPRAARLSGVVGNAPWPDAHVDVTNGIG
jgi:hypothetical protein